MSLGQDYMFGQPVADGVCVLGSQFGKTVIILSIKVFISGFSQQCHRRIIVGSPKNLSVNSS